MRARSANEWQKFKNFTWFGFLIRQLTISIHLQSLLTFHKAVRARQSLKSARAAMGNIMQKWAKTCHFLNRNSSSERPFTPNFYIMVGKSMGWRYDFIPPWLVKSETKSSYWHLNSKKCIFLMTSFLSLFNWDYLAHRSPIFYQILICCSWDNSLQEIWHLFFILMMASQWNSRLKATMQNFSDLRVMSMAGDFFSKHESAWQCSLPSISVVNPQNSPKF